MQVEGVDYFDTYAPVACLVLSRTIIQWQIALDLSSTRLTSRGVPQQRVERWRGIIQWVAKVSQCLVHFYTFENNLSIITNRKDWLVYERQCLIKAIQQCNDHVILIRNHGDISKSIWVSLGHFCTYLFTYSKVVKKQHIFFTQMPWKLSMKLWYIQ